MKGMHRRDLLRLGIGAGQLALLGGLGAAPLLRASTARAALGDGPKKLVTIYVRGGWMPELFFVPLDASQIAGALPAPEQYLGEPCFYDAGDVTNIDGTGDAPDGENEAIQRIRVPHLWEERGGRPGGTSPFGLAWQRYSLYERAVMVHGIDRETAAHQSGAIGAACGVASSRFTQPALHSRVAHRFLDAFPDRPVPVLAIGRQRAAPRPMGLDAPTTILSGMDDLEAGLSERNPAAWGGLRDRADAPSFSYDGTPTDAPLTTTAIDRFVLGRTRSLRGRSTAATDAFYEELYESLGSLSEMLGRDVLSTLERTPGWEHTGLPEWARATGTPCAVRVQGDYNIIDGGSRWYDPLSLATQFLKADLVSAVALQFVGPEGFNFDSHRAYDGPRQQFIYVRMVWEVIGRFLHELASTPHAGGSLLDDTLVLVYSEFSRSWPRAGSDHWPYTSVLFAGGGVHGNRQIGRFVTPPGGGPASSMVGMPVPMELESGDVVERVPTSRDIIATALHVMGIGDEFIPGGPGEILGVRA